MGAVSEGRVVGGSNPGGGEGDSFLESFDSRATAVTSGAGLMIGAPCRERWMSPTRTGSRTHLRQWPPRRRRRTHGWYRRRARTPLRLRVGSVGGRQRRGGGGGKSRIFLETRVWAKGRRRSRKLCVGGHPRTSPGGAIGSAEAALAQALVPLDVHLIAVEVRQVRAQLGDLRHALLELGGVLRMGRSHDGGELRERDLRG